MRRIVILASLAVPLVAAVVLAVIVARTDSGPADSQQQASPEPVVFSSSGAHASPATSTRSGSRSLAPSSAIPASPARTEPGRTARSARAALLAAKLQHVPRSPHVPPPATTSARESLPPEEVAAMEARGMDWRKLERMLREGVPGEPAAAAADPPAQVQSNDEEE